MTLDLMNLLHQALFGALAAAGFGVLFNIGPKTLIWAMGAGALALSVRTFGLQIGWSLEAASFAAALTASSAVRFVRIWLGAARNSVALAGCIPMVPGAFMSQAILGLFAATAPHAQTDISAFLVALEYMLRVIFTLGGIGAGLAIPAYLLRTRDF